MTNTSSKISSVRVLPTVDIPKPPPIPIQPFVPKDIGRINVQTPEMPTLVTEQQPNERVVSETSTGQSDDARSVAFLEIHSAARERRSDTELAAFCDYLSFR